MWTTHHHVKLAVSSLRQCIKKDTGFLVASITQPFEVKNTRCISGSKIYAARDMLPSSLSSGQNDLSKDILLENLKSATDTSEIFESLRLHSSIMNQSHQFVALNMLFQLEKSGNSNISQKIVVRSPEFNNLCKSILQQIQTYNTDDVITILKCLNYFEVYTSSKLVQACLQMLASNVNNLSLANIMFVDFLLSELKTCPLVEALKISLPIVFQAQYLIKVNHENNVELIEMLCFATKKNISEECSKRIVETLVERNIEFNERNVRSIIYSISCCKEITTSHEILLKKTLLWLSQNLNKMKFEVVDQLVTKLLNKYVWVDDIYYHEPFLNSVVEYLMQKDCGFTECFYILKKLARIHFVDKALLEYMANKLFLDPSLLENISPAALISYVTGLSDVGYKPPSWEMIQTYFLHSIENNFMINDKLELPWIKIALDLASLDSWPTFMYEKIFEKKFIEKYVRENNVLDYLQLLCLYQISQTLCPNEEIKSLQLPTHLLEKAFQVNGANREFPMKGALEKGLGGSEYVQTKVHTEHQHLIDHVIAMRQGGYPIPIHGIQTYTADGDSVPRVRLEDIKANVPESHYLIGIVALPPSAFTVNTQRIRGVPLMILKSLETHGVLVIPIHIDKWVDMPDQEKIPYLMQLIKSKENNEEPLENQII